MTAPQTAGGFQLSIVIPAFNEIARIPATLREVIQYVESRPEPSEVIVVDDGSGDATAARVEDF